MVSNTRWAVICWWGQVIQAHPTQRRKRIITGFPPPKVSWRSRSRGARSPGLGHSAMGTGGGAGDNQACAVSGSFLVLIHAGQPEFDSSKSSRPGKEPSLGLLDLLAFDEKSRASLDSPTFLIASFVVKLANILDSFF